MSEKRKLKKELGVFSATSVVVGCVIGAGVFFKPYAIYQATGGAPGMGMLAWIVGGLASIFAALTFAEVAVLIPKTGGMVAYLGEVFGERVGFLAGWMQVVIFYPAFFGRLWRQGGRRIEQVYRRAVRITYRHGGYYHYGGCSTRWETRRQAAFRSSRRSASWFRWCC